jgi:hypothetical protein
MLSHIMSLCSTIRYHMHDIRKWDLCKCRSPYLLDIEQEMKDLHGVIVRPRPSKHTCKGREDVFDTPEIAS